MVTESDERPPADCYSAGDRGFMAATQRLRARLFGPALSLLAECGVTADGLTALSLISGLGFCAASPLGLLSVTSTIVLQMRDSRRAAKR